MGGNFKGGVRLWGRSGTIWEAVLSGAGETMGAEWDEAVLRGRLRLLGRCRIFLEAVVRGRVRLWGRSGTIWEAVSRGWVRLGIFGRQKSCCSQWCVLRPYICSPLGVWFASWPSGELSVFCSSSWCLELHGLLWAPTGSLGLPMGSCRAPWGSYRGSHRTFGASGGPKAPSAVARVSLASLGPPRSATVCF